MTVCLFEQVADIFHVNAYFLVILTVVKHPDQWPLIKLCVKKRINQGAVGANACNFLLAFLYAP